MKEFQIADCEKDGHIYLPYVSYLLIWYNYSTRAPDKKLRAMTSSATSEESMETFKHFIRHLPYCVTLDPKNKYSKYLDMLTSL